MKLGLIRCMQTEDVCPAATCLKTIARKKGAFSQVEDELILTGISTCGGCPGKKAVFRAEMMAKQGAQAIALSTCITKGSHGTFPCPHKDQMLEAIHRKLGPDIMVFDYSHD